MAATRSNRDWPRTIRAQEARQGGMVPRTPLQRRAFLLGIVCVIIIGIGGGIWLS